MRGIQYIDMGKMQCEEKMSGEFRLAKKIPGAKVTNLVVKLKAAACIFHSKAAREPESMISAI